MEQMYLFLLHSLWSDFLQSKKKIEVIILC